eukprot:12499343-Ditylum_brightwellii.AAC.1
MLNILSEDEGNQHDIPMFQVEPTGEYMGVDEMKPLSNMEKKPFFLEHGELTHKDGYRFGLSKDKFIPYTSKKVKALYDDALAVDKEHPCCGVLVLDCTDPRVSAPGNIYEKAALVQEMYSIDGKEITVMAHSGKGISVKYPGNKWEAKDKAVKVDQCIDEIDNNERWGLRTPLFIFAFSKMRRGISYRSTRRVPTHIAILLGQGHNAMNVVQAMGRATFNGRSVLSGNGMQNVTLLTTSNDYVMARKVQNYIGDVHRQLQKGIVFHEAASGAIEKLPDSANFLRHTPRQIGQLKGQREIWKNLTSFYAPNYNALNSDEEEIKVKYWDSSEAQRLFRVFLEVSKESKRNGFGENDIQGAYNDTYRDDKYDLSLTRVKRLLKEFCDRSILSKDKGDSGISYKVICPKRLQNWYINDRLALTKTELSEGFNLSDVLGPNQ